MALLACPLGVSPFAHRAPAVARPPHVLTKRPEAALHLRSLTPEGRRGPSSPAQVTGGFRVSAAKVAGEGKVVAPVQDDPYIPVYVMLPLDTISMEGSFEQQRLQWEMDRLKSINVDGVMVDVWWGIVERHSPKCYNWEGYRNLFEMVRQKGLKLQVVFSFHQCGGNVGDNVHIPLPKWVLEVGDNNPDIFFTDKEGRRNRECLTWGVDAECVLNGRTALEVYEDYMIGFHDEFKDFLEDGTICEIEVGLGPCGELRYPAYAAHNGWVYPGIGQFQCYDKYLVRDLKNEMEKNGNVGWRLEPGEDAGHYNASLYEASFFNECDKQGYNSHPGRFFLQWYAQVLIEHGRKVLRSAKVIFKRTHLSAKLSGIHWGYKSFSHAPELTAGFYNVLGFDGYKDIMKMLGELNIRLNFTCLELKTEDMSREFPEAYADPEGLVWQVLNTAWDIGLEVAGENALPCYSRHGYDKVLENAKRPKPLNHPDGRHLVAFTYLRLCPALMEEHNLLEFERFVNAMHGS